MQCLSTCPWPSTLHCGTPSMLLNWLPRKSRSHFVDFTSCVCVYVSPPPPHPYTHSSYPSVDATSVCLLRVFHLSTLPLFVSHNLKSTC